MARSDLEPTPAGWDARLEAQDGHVLQSSAWGRVQEALGFPVAREWEADWSWQGSIRRGRMPRYLYVPYGPTATPEVLPEAVAAAAAAARDRGLDFLRFEPPAPATPAELAALGARPARPVQPPHTWIVDLDDGEPALLARLSETHRRNVRAAPRRGLTFRRSHDPADLSDFIELIRRTGLRAGFTPQGDRYYHTVGRVLMPGGMASLFFADHEGRPVAAVLGIDFGSTRYYAHAAADPEVSRRLSAGVPLAWWMMIEARAEGRRRFDLWGVAPPDRPDHPWAGISRFKRGFGGHGVDRPGTWELPLRPLRYRLFCGARALRRSPGAAG